MRILIARTVLAAGAVAAAGCGGGSSPSGASAGGAPASITLAANPNPIAGIECTRCGAQSTDREAVTTLTIQETAGVGGTVAAIAMVLRENGTNALIASGEFDTAAVVSLAGSSRVPAGGSLLVRTVGVHYPRDQAGRTATLTYTVRVIDDRGNTVSRDLAVAVSLT
jgi:hypothetical protein